MNKLCKNIKCIKCKKDFLQKRIDQKYCSYRCRNNRTTKKKKPYSYHFKRRLKRYSITEEQYNEMFNKQNGCCAICDIHQTECKKTFSIDHNHITGNNRGLLCFACNVGIGHFKDDISLLIKAIQYLENNLTTKKKQ